MPLESATYISGLVATNPVGATDTGASLDDHIRLIKSTVLATFPNVTGAVIPTHTELNYVDGVTSAIQTQLDTKITAASTTTLTNKRITARVGTVASSATPTINTDNVDVFRITAQAEAITSMTTNLSGTPTDSQVLLIEITGTAARAITWGTSFESSQVTLPTTTIGTNKLTVGFLWNSVTSKWRCLAVA